MTDVHPPPSPHLKVLANSCKMAFKHFLKTTYLTYRLSYTELQHCTCPYSLYVVIPLDQCSDTRSINSKKEPTRVELYFNCNMTLHVNKMSYKYAFYTQFEFLFHFDYCIFAWKLLYLWPKKCPWQTDPCMFSEYKLQPKKSHSSSRPENVYTVIAPDLKIGIAFN